MYHGAVQTVSTHNFGYLISYVLPGFVGLWGISYHSPTLRLWLGVPPGDAVKVGGFLYVTILSIGLGLCLSTFRWLVLDTIHARTGLPRPQLDFARLREATSGYSLMTAYYYEYYKAHGNGLMAVLLAAALRWTALGVRFGEAMAVACLAALLFLGSRDTLRKFYTAVEGLLAG